MILMILMILIFFKIATLHIWYVCIHVCIYVYICLYVYMYVYICIAYACLLLLSGLGLIVEHRKHLDLFANTTS